MDMSRIRIEGLLAAFPKLVGSGKQHTYVETENVRYVYQPIEVSSCCPTRLLSSSILASKSSWQPYRELSMHGLSTGAPAAAVGWSWDQGSQLLNQDSLQFEVQQ
jgi:hypothetical protein